MDLDFSPYATGGAQARSDSFTRLDPNFATGVYGLTQAAHAAGIPLQITSAYRSPPTQARIVADGMAKYGLGDRADAWRADVARLGPVAAGQQWRPEMREAGLTRFIAMPGGSQHQRGTAVDFALNGSLIRDADSPAAQFIRNNAAQYGLSVPMSWEPWQVEPVGSRDGSRPNAPTNTQTTGVGMDDTPQQPSGELSRSQRMMLGFAALRDAGAALQGQNSNFFADTMGGIQQQAQAADDRSFRQMQFDESVRQFGIGQAGSQAERDLRREQEARLARENQINILGQLSGFETQVRELEETNAARASAGLPPLPLNPYVASQISMLQRMLSQSGYSPTQGTGTPTQGAGTPTQGAGTPTQGAGTPTQGAGTPTQGAGTPTQGAGTPTQGAGTPTQGAGTPTQGAGTPTQGAGTPTQGAVTPTQGAVTQNAPAAYAVIDSPTSGIDDVTAAMAFLQNLTPAARDMVGEDAIEAAIGRGQARIDATRAQSEADAQDADLVQAQRDQLQTKGQTVVDYLLRGIDSETGEPILHPFMTNQFLRDQAKRYGSAEYTRFEADLNNIIETISAATIGILADRGISLGVNLTDTDMDIIRNIGTVMSVDNPLGTLDALRDFEEVMGIDLGLGAASAGGGSGAVSPDSPFRRIE